MNGMGTQIGQHWCRRSLALVPAATMALTYAACRAAFAAWDNLPQMTQRVVVREQELEVDAGKTWAKRIRVPRVTEDECPVLALRARVHTPGGGGCNFVLQVLFDDVPLAETALHLRLLNKPPWFDPPGTQYHFPWFSPDQQGWMTIFSPNYETNWGGTGRDFEFVFDLSGVVASGEEATLTFRYLNPSIPHALNLERAPLTLEGIVLGVMKRAEVEKLRLEVNKGQSSRQVEVEPNLPPNAKSGERPYEIVWSGRRESPPAQVAFDNLAGWTMTAVGDAKVALSASVEYLLWRKQLAKFTYGGGTADTVVEIRPPKPILIPGRFDAANLWLYGALNRNEDTPLRLFAVLEDERRREFQLDLGGVTATYWGMQHSVLSPKSVASARFPMSFKALVIANCKAKGERNAYLESLAFYQQNRKPAAKVPRPKPTVFPVSDDGMLPAPPADVKVTVRPAGRGAEFISKASSGVLRFAVRPEEGCLHGVTAEWDEGPRFRPMEGGSIKLDLGEGETRPSPDAAKLVSSTLKAGKLTARWRLDESPSRVDSRAGILPAVRPQTHVEWEATYSLRGRTLVVDVKCVGGAATGLAAGQVAGLPNPRGIEVPYLVMGQKPGPWVACARGLFVSVLPDWYHCDCSYIDTGVVSPKGDRIGLVAGTSYGTLTNGRRNNLRDRLLVAVSPEFAETLPNACNPVSPNRDRLAPYMFFMATHLTPHFFRTLKRYGIDHVIANDFAGIFVKDYAEGFAARWRPHPSLTVKQVQDYRNALKSLGYLFGMYIDARDVFPGNEFWNENIAALKPDGDWVDAWYGTYLPKPTVMPQLVHAVGEKAKDLYPGDCVYMDTHTNLGPFAQDYEAGVEGAGMGRPQVIANGDCIVEARKWYGSTMSEGIYRWMYAGLCDMDYATLYTTGTPADLAPLPDFDLLKIHPLQHGTMMSYAPGPFLGEKEAGPLYQDTGRGLAPLAFYKYVSASLAYGHMLILGYGYVPPLSRFIHYYALMQGVQREYLTDTVSEIRYHNGSEFLPTSRALTEDSQKQGRVRVRYSRGLTVYVNYNAEKSWMVQVDGRVFELAPYGWVIAKQHSTGVPDYELLAFSALEAGRRVDYVRCSDYIYLNTGDAKAGEGPLEVQGAVWLRREGKGWRAIPCGDLGHWEGFPPPGLPAHFRDFRLAGAPPDRGCPHLVLDTKALLDKRADEVKLTGRSESGEVVQASTKRLDADHLQMLVGEGVVDYLAE